MGISSTTNRASFSCDGSSTVFSFPYEFFSTADLKVFLYDSIASNVMPQTLGNSPGGNYTISGAQNAQGVFPSGGNVVLNSAAPTGIQLIVTRDPSRVNNYILNQNAPINSVALTQTLDYITTLIQRQQDEASRAVGLPDGLGTINGNSFNPNLPQGILLASSAYAPLTINSGSVGFQLGVVMTGSGGTGIGYAGTLPIVNGGTGQSGILPNFGVIYVANSSAMAATTPGSTNQFLLANNSSAPTFQNFSTTFISSGVLSVSFGGTGTGTSYIQYGVMFASSATQMANTVAGGQDQVLVGQVGAPPIFSKVNLASGSSVIGTLSTAFGGMGQSAVLSAQGVLFASSTTSVGSIIAGGQDQVLVGQAGTAPKFGQVNLATASSIIGALPILNGGTGQSSKATAFNALSPNAINGDISYFLGSSNVSIGVGATNQVFSVGVNSTIQWASIASLGNFSTTTKTANYTMTTNDDVILCNSSVFTVQLPDATLAAAKKNFVIKYIGPRYGITSLASVAISCSGLQTIDGNTTITCMTPNESWGLTSDGSNYQIIDHKVDRSWIAVSGSSNIWVNTAQFNSNSSSFLVQRTGATLRVRGFFKVGAVSASSGFVSLFSGALAAVFDQTTLNQSLNYHYGDFEVQQSGLIDSGLSGIFVVDSSASNSVFFSDQGAAGSGVWTKLTAAGVTNGNSGVSIDFEIPIQGWLGY